jgi:hypothetical protein
MELRVHLKVCEACGCLWFRAQAEASVYCSTCFERFKDFPTPQTRRRRGRPKKTTLPAVFAVEASHQSLAEGAAGTDPGFGAAAEIAGDLAHLALLGAQGSHSCLVPRIAGAL